MLPSLAMDPPQGAPGPVRRLFGWFFAIATDDQFALTKGKLLLGILIVLNAMNLAFSAVVLAETEQPFIVGGFMAVAQVTYLLAILLTRRGAVDTAAMMTALVITAIEFAVPLLLDGARVHLVFLMLPMVVTAFTARPRTTWTLCGLQLGGLTWLGLFVPEGPTADPLPPSFLVSIGMMLVLLAATSSVMQSLVQALTDTLGAAGERERQLRVRSESASQAKSQFLASMSHELRTPLTVIIGYAELLREVMDPGEPISEDDVEVVGRIDEAAQHLLVLISNVLDISRIDAGRVSLCVEEFDAAALVREVVAMLQPMAAGQGNQLSLVADVTELRVRLDRTKLRQIMFNLVVNALKFTEAGQVEVAIAESEERVVFTVRDSGCGIQPDMLDTIFDAFVQGPNSTTERHGGIGLGLALCSRFVSMMQGGIDVASTPDVGTTFLVELPRTLDLGETSHLGLEIPASPERVG